MSRLWQREAVIAIGLAWIVMSAADFAGASEARGSGTTNRLAVFRP